ncbi:hypothetical protein OG439_04345 [Amycolatopsis sp. NBC_01307]|uniref:hypothetical protein n=1 Tax=Amycolatopsis sp. NBC_01307 TaxID=2903561 RepID=UPI002E0FF8F4|nr:hypothetical protein OG439_04345 [Amycolatopsis sp. NBC_01307]
MTTFAVAYDRGAVNAAEVALSLGALGDLVFVGHEAGPAGPLVPLLRELGEVLFLDDGLEPVLTRLAAIGIDAVVTFSDTMMPVAARIADRLGLRFHSAPAVALLTDKLRQRDELRAHGVDEVRAHPVRHAGDWPGAVAAVGVPAVLKPLRGQGSRDTHLVTDAEAGARLSADLLAGPDPVAGLVLEEFLAGRPSEPFGDYVSVESVTTPRGVRHLAVTGKFPTLPPFREVGQFWPSPLSPAEEREVEELTGRALNALGVRFGVSHTEVKLTAAGPRIIEVNGRMGGHINDLARRAHGLDMVQLTARLALGAELPERPPRPEQVYFQYNTPAPVGAFTLLETLGVDDVRRVPGVTGYRPYFEPGTALPASVMTRPLDLISGVAADHDEMLARLARVLDRLTFAIDTGGGRELVTAAELGRARTPAR